MNILVDIGNSAVKWATLDADGRSRQSVPNTVHRSPHDQPIDPGCDSPATWWISCVNEQSAGILTQSIADHRPADTIRRISHNDLSLAIDLPSPERVGTDRLLTAVAVSQRKLPDRAAVIVDFGTATTVNLLSHDSRFLGGAILPGIQTQLNALGRSTDKLPPLDWVPGTIPDSAAGRDTESAILAGVVVGHAAAVEALIGRCGAALHVPYETWATGGGLPSPHWAKSVDAHYEPHLVLEGLALTCHRSANSTS